MVEENERVKETPFDLKQSHILKTSIACRNSLLSFYNIVRTFVSSLTPDPYVQMSLKIKCPLWNNIRETLKDKYTHLSTTFHSFLFHLVSSGIYKNNEILSFNKQHRYI